MKETWKDVVGYEGLYQVSNLGNVKSLDIEMYNNGIKKTFVKKGRILKPKTTLYGYKEVNLSKNKKHKMHKIHRLVGKSFIENNMNKKTINHIDGDKTNNSVDNLEWATYRENNIHGLNTGLIKIKSRKGISITLKKLNKEISFPSINQTSKYLNVDNTTLKRYMQRNKKIKGYEVIGDVL